MIRSTARTRTRTAHAKLAALTTAGVLGASLIAFAPAASAATYTCHPSWKASGGLYYLYEGYSDTNTTNTKKGQTGDRVIEVQCLLTYWANRVGDSKYSPKGIDGEFGTNTENAVINAQKACFSDSKEWDGEVGQNTWPCLRRWSTT
ncbi:peptidoglycan-binding protein [Streptomyces fuscichromogenes]|uniref:peptidoglycan-binding domain-containing protein n=1 Tax=Streptomyces fuscichromogenes TaxID=1324013 RepID=UPI0037FE88CA